MGTKNNPGAYDCYNKSEPDEPMFVLLGRDKHAPTLIWLWATLRELDGEDEAKVKEARDCVAAMIVWAVEHDRKPVGLGHSTLAGVLELIRMANITKQQAKNEPTGVEFVRRLLTEAGSDALAPMEVTPAGRRLGKLANNSLSFEEFWEQHAIWSQATFGTDAERGPVGPLKHLLKEAAEALEKTWDLEEYADCLFLVFDACRRAGYTCEQLRVMVNEKLKKNMARKWSKPTSDEPVEHVREGVTRP